MPKQIALQQKVAPKIKKKRQRKPLLIFTLVASVALLALILFAVYAFIIPAQRILTSVNTINSQLGTLAAGFSSNDLTNLEATIQNVNTELDNINVELERFDFLAYYDFSKGYYHNVKTIRKLSSELGDLLDKSYPEIKSTIAALGFKVDEQTVTNIEDGKELNAVIKELPKIVGLYEKYEPDVIQLMATVNELDPNYIPAVGGFGKYAERLRRVQNITHDFPALSTKVREIMRAMPDLLGSSKPANYLVLFQNEKELRASSGIISAYGNLQLDKGEVVGEISAIDMWDLQNYLWQIGRTPRNKHIGGQLVLMERGCGSAEVRAQDVGIYPDLYVTVDTFMDYYDAARRFNPNRFPAYEHVIIINTYFASDLVSFIDPISDPETGRTITEDNLAKEIFTETSSQPFDPRIRKQFIGTIASTSQEKFKELPTDQLFDVVVKMFDTIVAKNLALVSKDANMQTFFDEFALSGRFEKNFGGDYFHLNEAQNCSLKANFYIRDTVTQNIKIETDNSINKAINVQWRNEKVYDPAEEYILTNNSRFLYRAWVRVVTPPNTQFVSSDGYAKSGIIRYRPTSYFDKTFQMAVSDNVIRFDHRRPNASAPVKTHDLNVSYRLPANLNYDPTVGYKMLVQKHPGKRDELYKINIDYQGEKTSTEFTLNRDKVVTFRGGVLTVEDYPHRLDEYSTIIRDIQALARE